MTHAIIHRPCKNAMQSGANKGKHWVLEYTCNNRSIDSIMGWTSSADTMQQLKINFHLLEDAIAYAKKNGVKYQIIEYKAKEKKALKAYVKNYQ